MTSITRLGRTRRATHIERTRLHVASQLASLTATHQARQQLLEDQILSATHDNIRRMRESELRSLEEDFEARRRRLGGQHPAH